MNVPSAPRPLLVGIGELLWDLLPTGPHLGGAPANFAYIAALLGARSALVSRIAADELGEKAQIALRGHGLDLSAVQVDSAHATGTAGVIAGPDGTERFSIAENVAWDYVCWTPGLADLAWRADAVCCGTLAQRSIETRRTIRRFLESARPACLRVLDVNIRPPFFTPAVLLEILPLVSVLKLSHQELPEVLRACSLPLREGVAAAQSLQRRWSLKAICITRGRHGSVLVTEKESAVHPGVPVEAADTVGAGDAFTAAMTIKLLAGSSIEEVSRGANVVGAWVASQPGAMPAPEEAEQTRLRSMFWRKQT